MPDVIDKDYSLEVEKKDAQDEKVEATGVPVYMEAIKLNEEQKKRLSKEIFAEFDEIEQERKEDALDQLWDALDAQYEGKLQEDTRRMFNLNKRITKVKVNRVTNLIMQAYLKSDPIYSIGPRPEFSRQGGQEICDKQSDFIDDRLDSLPYREAEGLTVHSAVLKGVGILKISHEIKREKRRREERYEGKNEIVGIDANNNPIIRNKGLEEFLSNWPDAHTRYPGFVRKLMEEKTIEFVASYNETTYNDPYFKSVDLKNFYVRKATEGYEGLKTTRLIVERTNYSWWELKQMEKKGSFSDIKELTYKADDKDKARQTENYEYKTYDVLECNYYFKLKEDDEEEIKIKCWIGEERKIVIGTVYYPYYAIGCDYVPHYIAKKRAGFYQTGMGEDLTDSNIAESAILNFILEGAYIGNMVTPITPEGSAVDQQFLERRWTHGIPINAKGGEIDFLQKYMRPMDIGGLLNILQYLIQGDDDVTGVSSLMSGRESPLDPSAPATKTIALLQQSGINVEDYILAISPAFNEIGYIILNIYYQISKEGRKYTLNTERVVGSDPFATISRNELATRTNIQVRAYSFDFDKLNEKKEDLALYQVLRNELLIARNPQAIHTILKNIIKNWSPKWKNNVDFILPPLEQLKKEQVMVTLQAVTMYIEQKQKDAQITGAPMQLQAEELLPLVSDLTAQIATPPDPEIVKSQQKGAQ